MRLQTWIGFLFILLLVSILCGCHDHKSVGPEPVLPEGGTKLYFKDCDPFSGEPLWASLTANPDSACNAGVSFIQGQIARWQSNWFLIQPGTYREGYHLVFERSSEQAADSDKFDIVYSGIGVNFTRRVVLVPGESRSIVDIAETATVSATSDSLVSITMSISAVTGGVTLDVASGTGSYVATSALQTTLCEFEVNQGLTHGLGQPNQGLNFSYLGATSTIQTSLVDFTGGAVVLNNLFTFGPSYGPCYLVASSGHCVDTAAFYACPPALSHRQDTVGTYNTSDLYGPNFEYVKQIVSNGTRVWFWFVEELQNDTTACRKLSITWDTNFPFVTKKIVTCYNQANVYYDKMTDLVWIIERSSTDPDSAWGYTTAGLLDTIVTAETIPTGILYQGQWLNSQDSTALTRTAYLTPFAGGATTDLGEYPVELARNFGGQAGFSEPHVAGSELWAVNLFNSSGNWTDRYTIASDIYRSVQNVYMLMADDVIVYMVETYYIDIHQDSISVRALQPH